MMSSRHVIEQTFYRSFRFVLNVMHQVASVGRFQEGSRRTGDRDGEATVVSDSAYEKEDRAQARQATYDLRLVTAGGGAAAAVTVAMMTTSHAARATAAVVAVVVLCGIVCRVQMMGAERRVMHRLDAIAETLEERHRLDERAKAMIEELRAERGLRRLTVVGDGAQGRRGLLRPPRLPDRRGRRLRGGIGAL